MINDEYMVYDTKMHKYVLTLEAGALLPNFNSAFPNEDEGEEILKEITENVYGWIYGRIPFSNKNYIEYKLAVDDNFRGIIYDALMAQLKAHLRSGINDLNKQLGVNIENGMIIEDSVLLERSICPETKRILENSDGDFNILYAAEYGVDLPLDKYSRWSY